MFSVATVPSVDTCLARRASRRLALRQFVLRPDRSARRIEWTFVPSAHRAGRGRGAEPLTPRSVAATTPPTWPAASAQSRKRGRLGASTRDARTLAETDGQPDGFRELLTALRDETVAFRRPVALGHGDSHYFRIDKPLQDAEGRRVENFTRVETFGDHQENGNNDVNWLKVRVDPDSREVFSYQPQIVPRNRTAVPRP